MPEHNSEHNTGPDITISSGLKPGPSIRIEARAFPGNAGSIVETINGFDRDTDTAVLGRALGAIIRNAWMMAQDIDRERGSFGGTTVIESILSDWKDGSEEVCLRCGEDMQEDREPACSRCGSLDIYREADGHHYEAHAKLDQFDKMAKARALVRFARAAGFPQARVAVWNTDNPEGSQFEHPVEELQEYQVAPATGEHDLGIYLYATVYSGIKDDPEDEGGEPLGETFDSKEERDAWMAADQEGGGK